MWKNVLFTMWFQDFVTVFNQSYNCQTSHYLGRNQLPNAFLMLLSLVQFHTILHTAFFSRNQNEHKSGNMCTHVWVCFCIKKTRFKGNIYMIWNGNNEVTKWVNSDFPDYYYCWHFLITTGFEPLYFVKICPIFVTLAFLRLKKHQIFLYSKFLRTK